MPSQPAASGWRHLRAGWLRPGWQRCAWLIAGFGAAVGIRCLVGGPAVAESALAGLVFAACLVGLSWRSWRRTDVTLRALAWGVFGAAVLFIPVALTFLPEIQHHSRPAGSYVAWAGVVALVALAEELFLRGALYASLRQWRGRVLAIVVGAALFAALHVPLYGWRVVPLDFAVGLWLGALRASSGSWVAPGVAHVLADWGAWWIV